MTDRDKRKLPRFESRLFVQIKSVIDDTDFGRGVMIDVSLGGFGIETETDLLPGKTYAFQVEIPVTLQAKVVRQEVPGQVKRYGLKLEGLSFIDKFILKKLLKGTRNTQKV